MVFAQTMLAHNLRVYLMLCVVVVAYIVAWNKPSFGNQSKHLVQPTRPQSSRGAMLIVEPRNHSNFERVTKAFSAVVPLQWTLYVVHTNSNAYFVAEALKALQGIRRVVFMNISTSSFVNLRNFGSGHNYNTLFKTLAFWNSTIPPEEEHVLVFQTDGMPCTSSQLDVERFGRFGYVGCMCDIDKVGPDSVPFFRHYGFYGIGGVSLRRRSFMLDCLSVYPDACPDAEDTTFSSCNDVLAYKYGPPPTVYDVGDFCGQNGWGNSSRPPQSWASHKVRMSPENTRRFLEYCPSAITVP